MPASKLPSEINKWTRGYCIVLEDGELDDDDELEDLVESDEDDDEDELEDLVSVVGQKSGQKV